MLYRLKGALTAKKKEPVSAVMTALGCSEKTARNKLNGSSPVTLPEAIKIVDAYFRNPDDNPVKYEELFLDERDSA